MNHPPDGLFRTGYAQITRDMPQAITEQVKGKRVVDMGAGIGALSTMLIHYGAKSVVAIEKEPGVFEAYGFADLEVRTEYASAGPREGEHFDVLVLSWPVNHAMPGLLEKWLPAADVVVYIGCNDGRTACGWRGLFHALAEREVLEHIEHPLNDLLVVGPRKVERALTKTELDALKSL